MKYAEIVARLRAQEAMLQKMRDNPSEPYQPNPIEVLTARNTVELTQTEAARLIHYTWRAWAAFETDDPKLGRAMSPALWRLWLHLAGIEPLPRFKLFRPPEDK